MSRDPALLASTFMANVAFLGMSWKQMLGRPTITLLATQYLLGKHYYTLYLTCEPNINLWEHAGNF